MITSLKIPLSSPYCDNFSILGFGDGGVSLQLLTAIPLAKLGLNAKLFLRLMPRFNHTVMAREVFEDRYTVKTMIPEQFTD